MVLFSDSLSQSPKNLLDGIRVPRDLKSLSTAEMLALADQMRARLIDVCSRTGGHIGAGLGVVELTIALHHVFDSPTDQLVWDVGHQGYPHKLLTGRNSMMETLRKENGISGFLRRSESEFDTFGAGHAATAISAAFGIAKARDLRGEDFKVVAIVGDGALTCGLAYEGLNNAGASSSDILIVLNDNDMSIAPNVGAISTYLVSVQRNPKYNRLRSLIGNALHAQRGLTSRLAKFVRRWEASMKAFLTPGALFEELGFRYFGPIDGHDIAALVETFSVVRGMRGPRFIHVITQKGKGFPAGESRQRWHALPPNHDPATGQLRAPVKGNKTYTAIFGQALADLGREDDSVVAITAAMDAGTGTDIFAKEHPDRFFDVGIAEAHAVTFAAGMATRGIRPICAIYSSFLQRAYDSILHDVAVQKLPVIFAMDRAGVVGDDGPTHMGLYDIAYMLAVPGMTVTAPKNGTELVGLLRTAIAHHEGPFCIRYPRDSVPDAVVSTPKIPPVPYGTWEMVRDGADLAILAVGTMVLPSLRVADELAGKGVDVSVVNCRFLKPLDLTMLDLILAKHGQLLVVEEGTIVNGFGAYVSREIARLAPSVQVETLGVPDRIVEQASRVRQLAGVGLDEEGITRQILAALEQRSTVI